MASRVMYWVSTLLSALALLFVVANALLVSGSRDLQAEINQRQQQINAGMTFAQIYQSLGSSLGAVATAGKDEEIRKMLVAQGIQLPAEQKTNAPEAAKAKK